MRNPTINAEMRRCLQPPRRSFPRAVLFLLGVGPASVASVRDAAGLYAAVLPFDKPRHDALWFGGTQGFLVEDKDAHVILATIASNLDLFQFWSLVWAALGLSIMLERAKWGVAVGIAGGVWLLGLLAKVAINSLSGVVIV